MVSLAILEALVVEEEQLEDLTFLVDLELLLKVIVEDMEALIR
jgi:hypothetical protein